MIRKLYLELRWLFPIMPIFLIALTLEFTWMAERSWIMYYSDNNGFGVEVWPSPQHPHDYDKDLETFRRDHPQGYRISLKEQPSSYFMGFDAIARLFLPYIVIALCSGGGILCEKASGTTSFLLSLPVRRSRWLWSRAGALLLLTFATALLSSLAAMAIAKGMQIHGNGTWLLTESLRLTLLGAPWIGVTMFVQSLLSGRLDTTSETIISALVAGIFAFATNWFLSYGVFSIFPEVAFSNPWHWYAEIAADNMGKFSLMTTMLVTYVLGIAGLMFSIRRFERMDF